MHNLLTAGQIAAALLTICSLLALAFKYAVVVPLKAYIEKMTYPIQPHANGGKALPDLVEKVDLLHLLVKTHLKTHNDTPK